SARGSRTSPPAQPRSRRREPRRAPRTASGVPAPTPPTVRRAAADPSPTDLSTAGHSTVATLHHGIDTQLPRVVTDDRVVPTPGARDQRIRLLGAPRVNRVRHRARVAREHRVDDGPGGLDAVLAREQEA